MEKGLIKVRDRFKEIIEKEARKAKRKKEV
jgi:hypothetical protein